MITFFVQKHLRDLYLPRSYPPLRKLTPLSLLCGCVAVASLTAAQTHDVGIAGKPVAQAPAPVLATAAKQFIFQDAGGKQAAAPLVDQVETRKLTLPTPSQPQASAVNPALTKAATIAQERANAHSKRRCWRYVKEALLAAGAVDSYPQTALAKQAGNELVENFGFQKLTVTDPYKAPVGAVLVYDAEGAAGHVEIRTKTGFVSDFSTPIPSKRKLIGIYTKA